MNDSTPTANEKFVINAVRAMMKGDADTFFDAFSEDVVVIEPASLPYGGAYQGRDNFRALFGELYRLWDDWNVTVEDSTSNGDLVYLMVRFEATARATGTRVAFPIVEIWQVTDGQAVFLQPIYGDTALALEALGVGPKKQDGLVDVRFKR